MSHITDLRRAASPWSVLFVIVAVALVVAACGDDDAATGDTAESPDVEQALMAHGWVLDGAASTPVLEATVQPVTIVFDDGGVHGTGPCNTFTGQFEVTGDSIAIGPLASTMMACPDDQAETVFFGALEAVDTVAVDDETLTLSGDDVELVFEAFDPQDLLVGTWSIISVNTGDSIDSVITGTDPTLTFEEDGTAVLVTGCNDGATTWELDGDELTFGPVAQTMMACDDPPGIMEQEQALSAALEATVRVEVTPGRLTLLDEDDRMLIVAAPEGSS